jgi:hypothetical protein
MSKKTEKRTATQRIEDLEKVLASVYQAVMTHREAIEALAPVKEDMALVKDALKLINKRVEAVVQAAKPESGITSQSVSDLLVQMNVADLASQVQGHLANGHLSPTDTVAKDTFLVCEEFDSNGTMVNPRIQFRLDSQDAQTQELLTGKKVGETVTFGEGKLSAKITEVYALTLPTPPQASEEAAPEAQTSEAPASA